MPSDKPLKGNLLISLAPKSEGTDLSLRPVRGGGVRRVANKGWNERTGTGRAVIEIIVLQQYIYHDPPARYITTACTQEIEI